MSRAACKFFIDLAELKKKIKRKTRETVQSLAGFCIYNPDPRNPDPCLMMATHSGAAASRAPATKPFFSGSGLFVSGNSASFTHQRYSRTKLLDIKGGGLCLYVNKGWCSNCGLVKSHCSEALEKLTVKCRPFYLPREFTAVLATIVYIPPGANANNKASEALQELHDIISSLQTKRLEIVRDFNQVRLTDVLPRLHQHVDFPTRGNNTLDCVYSNICGAYRA